MRRRYGLFSYLLAIIVATACGVALAYGVLATLRPVLVHFKIDREIAAAIPLSATTTAETKAVPVQYIEPDRVEVPATGKFVVADLSAMTITLYQDGQLVEILPVLTIGKAGTAWETPRGVYQVKSKERNHFSTIGRVYMPYSLQFNGNYFFHGETYYPDGTPVAATFSGGCIKLKTVDAKKIFDFAPIGTPVVVKNSLTIIEAAGRWQKVISSPPTITTETFLIADATTGEIISAQNANRVRPIGTLARLMTGLVTLDAINFFNQTKVKINNDQAWPAATLLLPGEKIEIKQLLYPLFFGDNGAAAATLARIIGAETFVAKMNDRAGSAGLVQTTFTDPAGLASDNTSSALDLFRLARHLKNYKNYLWVETANPSARSGLHYWVNQNGLTDLPGFLGGLVGKAPGGMESGLAIIAVPSSGMTSRPVIISVLGSAGAVADLRALADLVQKNYRYGPAETDPIKPVSRPASGQTVLSFVGDVMLGRGVEQLVKKNGGDFNYPFADLLALKNSDVLFGNLEGPVSDQGKDLGNAYSFRMSPAVVPVLAKQGFTVLSVANNHAGDWTIDALADTFRQFAGSGVSLVGGGPNRAEAVAPKIIEKNGLKIGYLGFSDVGPNWLLAGTTSPGILSASDPDLSVLIAAAAQKCDVLVVAYHFGDEYELAPNWRQKQLAYLAIDSGAKIVVGTHPHVPQAVENYKDGVIMYSLGNFIFDQNFSTSTMQGLAVKVHLNGKEIESVEKFNADIDSKFRVSVE